MPDPQIADLVRSSRGDAEAQVYLQLADSRTHAMAAANIGRDILQHVNPVPGACAVMSALYTVLLRDRHPETVTHMVAGKLYVGDACVFGREAEPTDWAQALSASSGDWDGHCWIVIGDYIVDVSVFRTAYSTRSPPVLARAVRDAFGTGKGLMIARDTHPLRYQPEYVLTDAQIDALAGGALRLFGAR